MPMASGPSAEMWMMAPARCGSTCAPGLRRCKLRESERRVPVYEEAPGFRPGPLRRCKLKPVQPVLKVPGFSSSNLNTRRLLSMSPCTASTGWNSTQETGRRRGEVVLVSQRTADRQSKTAAHMPQSSTHEQWVTSGTKRGLVTGAYTRPLFSST